MRRHVRYFSRHCSSIDQADVANALFALSGKDLKALYRALGDENPQAVDVHFTLPKKLSAPQPPSNTSR
jgi:hypothetical protein